MARPRRFRLPLLPPDQPRGVTGRRMLVGKCRPYSCTPSTILGWINENKCSVRRRIAFGPRLVNCPKELYSLGLIEKVSSTWRNDSVSKLIPVGLKVAHALISESPDVAAQAHEIGKRVGLEARILGFTKNEGCRRLFRTRSDRGVTSSFHPPRIERIGDTLRTQTEHFNSARLAPSWNSTSRGRLLAVLA